MGPRPGQPYPLPLQLKAHLLPQEHTVLGVWVPLLADPCILVTLISLKNGSTAESIWRRGVRGIILVFKKFINKQ